MVARVTLGTTRAGKHGSVRIAGHHIALTWVLVIIILNIKTYEHTSEANLDLFLVISLAVVVSFIVMWMNHRMRAARPGAAKAIMSKTSGP
jgi:hypothetical protein